MSNDPRYLIRAKREAISAARKDLLAKLESINQAEQDLITAERVLNSLTEIPDEMEAATTNWQNLLRQKLVHAETTRTQIRRSIPRHGSDRPIDIPTVVQMTEVLLAEAEATGKAGLTGRELLDAIHQRWWPGVGWDSILPTINRAMRDRNIFVKEGNLFTRNRSRAAERALVFG